MNDLRDFSLSDEGRLTPPFGIVCESRGAPPLPREKGKGGEVMRGSYPCGTTAPGTGSVGGAEAGSVSGAGGGGVAAGAGGGVGPGGCVSCISGASAMVKGETWENPVRPPTLSRPITRQ